MAGGHHDAAVGFLRESRIVDFLGAAQTDVQHVGAAFGHTGDQRVGQLWAGQAHIAADGHSLGVQLGNERPTDPIGQRCVQLVRYACTDVIGFEERIMIAHGR